MILDHKISILERFLKDHAAIKNQMCSDRKQLFKIFTNISLFLFYYFLSNKCCINEHKGLISKTWKKSYWHQTFELYCILSLGLVIFLYIWTEQRQIYATTFFTRLKEFILLYISNCIKMHKTWQYKSALIQW